MFYMINCVSFQIKIFDIHKIFKSVHVNWWDDIILKIQFFQGVQSSKSVRWQVRNIIFTWSGLLIYPNWTKSWPKPTELKPLMKIILRSDGYRHRKQDSSSKKKFVIKRKLRKNIFFFCFNFVQDFVIFKSL